MGAAILYHLLDVVVHRVLELRLWNDFVLVLTSSILEILQSCLGLRCNPLVVLFEIENCQLSFCNILLLKVWTYNNSEEGKALSVEVYLLRVMGHEILNGRVYFENRMTVIPCKLLNSILIHLVLNLDLFLVRYLTIFEPNRLALYARFSSVNLGDDQILDVVSLVSYTSQQPNYLMLAEIRVNVHEHLHFESEVNPVRLRLKGLIVVALH